MRFTQQDNYGSTIRAIDYFFLAVLIKGVKVDREYERGVIFRLVACQLYFDGLLDSQSLAKIDLRVLVAPHFKLDRPLVSGEKYLLLALVPIVIFSQAVVVMHR